MALPSTPTTCFAVTAALSEETGRFGPQIYSKSAYKAPIIRMQSMTRGPWTDAMGDIHNHLTYQRGFPTQTTANLWTNVTPSDGDANNACTPPKIGITFAQKTRTSRLRHFAVESPYFCIEDIRNRVMFEKQLAKHRDILTDISWWVWYQRMTTDYVDTCEHNLTINQAAGIVDNGGNGYSVVSPGNAQLEQSHLDDIYLSIIREGPEEAPAVDLDTGAPVIELIVGKETSDALLANNQTNLTNLRWAEMGRAMDTDFLPNQFPKKRRVYGNFVHNFNPYPRRFSIINGAYVEVPTWAANAVTIGNASDLNPDWKTATYEETIIWMPGVYRSMVPSTLTEPAPGWKFNPINYMGDFRAVNILDRTCNVDGTNIFWRAIFSDAAEPVHPEYGYSIIHARCNAPKRFVACNYDSYYNDNTLVI